MKTEFYKKYLALALFNLLVFNLKTTTSETIKHVNVLINTKEASAPESKINDNIFQRVARRTVGYLRKFFWDNFHTVERNMCYRSKQLTAARLKKYSQKYNIKTIINLRGTKENKSWWTEEQEFAKNNNIKIIDIRLSADELPLKNDILNILNAFDSAQKPILIHCRRGADRTGMIAALWVLDKMGKNKKYAKAQLSLWYGHYKYFTPHMIRFIEMWEGREWFLNSYNI